MKTLEGAKLLIQLSVTQDPKSTPRAPRLARPSPASRESKAALTLCSEGVEGWGRFCHLAAALLTVPPLSMKHVALGLTLSC